MKLAAEIDAGEKGPLSGIRVLELGQLIAGPFCGQLLADFGAEVVKDPMRNWGQVKSDGMSLWWPIISRNKKCITLNMRTEEGREIAKELISSCDILIENFRPGTMEKWGLSYEILNEINPRLIMVRVSGYGQTGPYAKRPGYASIGEAMGGLRHVIGYPDREPCRAGISIGDTVTGMFAAIGALLALHSRDKTGHGQVVDAAIYESVFALMESTLSEFVSAGYVRGRTGSILPKIAPTNVYPARDGSILIAANQDSIFKRLAHAMGMASMADDIRYATHVARGEQQAELDALIANWSKDFTVEELEALLNECDVPNGRIFTAPDILEDIQYKAREAIVRVAHPILGEVTMQNTFPKLSSTPGRVNWCGPDLGHHNHEIYIDQLGYSLERYSALKTAEIV
jgi:formyl-CoA transferase